MPKQITQIDLFVASPSDVIDERNAFDEVIEEVNTVLGSIHNFVLVLKRWETDVHPSVGADSQDVINKQIDNQYDIFVGIMWGKFGTPTLRSESGTKEEFELAFAKHQKNDIIDIMFYFKNSPIELNKIDVNQLSLVNEFKIELRNRGVLYNEFDRTDQFKQLLRIHLSKVITNYFNKNKLTISQNTKDNSNVITQSTEVIKNEVDDEEETGIFEAINYANDELQNSNHSLTKLAEYITELGEEFTSSSVALQKISQKPNDVRVNESIRLLDNAANAMDKFTEKTKAEIVFFSRSFQNGVNSFADAYSMAIKYDMAKSDANYALQSMKSVSTQIPSMIDELKEFRTVVDSFPSLTRKLNSSKRRLLSVIDNMIHEFTFTLQLLLQFNNIDNNTEDQPAIAS